MYNEVFADIKSAVTSVSVVGLSPQPNYAGYMMHIMVFPQTNSAVTLTLDGGDVPLPTATGGRKSEYWVLFPQGAAAPGGDYVTIITRAGITSALIAQAGMPVRVTTSATSDILVRVGSSV